jgi:hypothetical protein
VIGGKKVSFIEFLCSKPSIFVFWSPPSPLEHIWLLNLKDDTFNGRVGDEI